MYTSSFNCNFKDKCLKRASNSRVHLSSNRTLYAMNFDIFISHASEDKEDLVRPLAELLRQRGLRIWLDETELRLGDSLLRSIDRGLCASRFGLVILSPSFLKKEWPRKELDGLAAREDGKSKVILPIWHNVTRDDILDYSPLLADKIAAPTSKGLVYIVDQVVAAVEDLPHSSNSAQYSKTTARQRSHTLQQLIVRMLDRVQESVDLGSPRVTGLPSGLHDLDLVTCGFQAESLVIIAGRPESGKTALTLGIADHVVCNEGLPVLIFCPTHSAGLIVDRMICASGNIDPYRLRSGSLTDLEWPSLTEAVERYRDASLHINDSSYLSFEEIQDECRLIVDLHGALGLVILDSLQKVIGENAKENDSNSIIRKLKILAREIRAPILVTTDLKRSVDLRVDQRPILSDLREMGGIEQHSDLVLFLHRDAGPHSQSIGFEVAELVVAKQRGGALTGKVRLKFRGDIGRFENIVHHSNDFFKDETKKVEMT